MVEFALVGPIAFLVLLGGLVLGIVILHQIQLTQAVRDSARAAAICGSRTGQATTTSTLPDGSSCKVSANIVAYINTRITAVDPILANAATVTVYCDGSMSGCSNSNSPPRGSVTGLTAGTAAATCANGYTIEVSVTYNQPLYLPLVGNLLGSSGGNTRTISAKGEATCEQ
jgi:Flp pilus assembly protein TadG